jgi:hypothetical protein
MEIVDGGRLENVVVSDVDIQGVSVPIFLRLGNRARPYAAVGGYGIRAYPPWRWAGMASAHTPHRTGAKPGVGTFRNVVLNNITASRTSEIGCSITGLPGHPIENVVLANVRLGFDGGGTKEHTTRQIPEQEKNYPESTMFGTLPAYGFYCRHVRGLKFSNVQLRTDKADLRHAMMFDDAQDVEIDALDAQCWSGAAAMLRMVEVRQATIRGCSPKSAVDTLLQLEGDATEKISLEKSDLGRVRKLAAISAEVPEGALSVKKSVQTAKQ